MLAKFRLGSGGVFKESRAFYETRSIFIGRNMFIEPLG